MLGWRVERTYGLVMRTGSMNSAKRSVSCAARTRRADPRHRRRPPCGHGPLARSPIWGRVARFRRPRRRLGLILGIGVATAVVVATLALVLRGSGSFELPSHAVLAGMDVRQRVVAIAYSQVGYRTEPSHSYCNKFSAQWYAGTAGCPNGGRSEEW